jgi:regulator of protease activity HflC (stomatin/prohibitin superfamily)
MNARVVVIALVMALVGTGCVRIDSGHRGVLFKWFGGTQDVVFEEGVHIVAPWNRLIPYDVRVQDRVETVEILTSNGLSVSMEVSVRFKPDIDDLPLLHTDIGPSYYDKIVKPIVRSEVRKIVGGYTPEQIYASKRPEVESSIFEAVKGAIEKKPLLVEAVMIRNVELPTQLKDAISDKLEEEQRSLKMAFVLERERQEAERKRIEAKGIADFQEIVSAGISENLLRWKGIEATEDLASSENAKVVVIGGGGDGLPLILGGQ